MRTSYLGPLAQMWQQLLDPQGRNNTQKWVFILSVLTRHVKDNQGIRRSQRGFMKGRSCLTNLISFYDQARCLVDEEKAVDVA